MANNPFGILADEEILHFRLVRSEDHEVRVHLVRRVEYAAIDPAARYMNVNFAIGREFFR